MMTVQCPSCRRVHPAPETILGKKVQCRDCGSAFVATAAQDGVPSRTAAPATQPTTAPLPPQAERPVSEDGQLVHPFEKPAPAPATELAEFSVVSPGIGAKRPFGLVWVIFFWVIQGLGLIALGVALSVAMGALGGASGSSRGFDPFNLDRGPAGGAVLAVLGIEFAGVLLFHYGLLLLVACYGLWTFRRWGVPLARALAIVGVVLGLIILIVSIVSRAGVVAGVVGLLANAAILVYLYGRLDVSALRKYLRTPGAGEGMWKGYE